MNVAQSCCCTTCGAIAADKGLMPRIPCETCGSVSRTFDLKLDETVKARAGLGYKLKRSGAVGRAAYESKNVWEHNFDHDEVVNVQRVIDRESDRYSECIKTESGKILRQVDEPLSEHWGHGDAKPKKAN